MLSKNLKIRIHKTIISPVVLYRCLVSDIKERTWTEGVLKQCAEKNIWTEEGCGNGRVEKTA
jgi:hypothetical protein